MTDFVEIRKTLKTTETGLQVKKCSYLSNEVNDHYYIGDTYDVIICEHLLINLSLLKDNY